MLDKCERDMRRFFGKDMSCLVGYEYRRTAWVQGTRPYLGGENYGRSPGPCDHCDKPQNPPDLPEVFYLPTCRGECLCKECWEKDGRFVVQCYPGDWGGSIMPAGGT